MDKKVKFEIISVPLLKAWVKQVEKTALSWTQEQYQGATFVLEDLRDFFGISKE